METDRRQLNDHILQVAGEISKLTGPAMPEEWLSSEVTVTQLRLLLNLHTRGPQRMSDIALNLTVSLPTASLIVENLVHKNLVRRAADPRDRRVVICKLSSEGLSLVSRLWDSGRNALEKLMQDFTLAQLQKTAEVIDLLHSNAKKFGQTDQPSRNNN
jgi:DNA-binding MarR family transcriptional regulator